MDELEFRRLIDLFPIVRSRDYHAESDLLRKTASSSAQDVAFREWQDAWDEGDKRIDLNDPFWEKLKSAAERTVDAASAARFCKAFQCIHKQLVYEELSMDAAINFVNSAGAIKE